MTAQFARAPLRGRSGTGVPSHEPHAALLIDFDNVTMGIRSDLTKELKNLLNSDIIKGKVAVQRAYADWRRYPQYIVPLAESSVDLIFAPAYGSAKKNATDIRLAIDAVELVFTRPEIGTIILLSGDSDFSSLVLKLKEYGKYVIGVGIRESASDLLVQNCDEYYSYSALTGLTRAGDETTVVSEDPWELVEMALRQMMDNDDVMRSDRLKQVLLEMDPGFDEKALGFQKFNKFLQEAANRGIISLRKQENGQYEVGPPSAEAVEGAAAAARGEAREGREARSRRGRRGRGRREDGRERADRDEAEPAEEAPPQPAAAREAAAAPEAERAASPVQAEAPAAAAEAPEPRPPREERKPEPVPPPADAGEPVAASGDLAGAYGLLRRATSDLVRKGGGVARDSDVKRRMIELQPGWDETDVGFSKFSRFLRQAHDAQVVTLRRDENGNYDVVPGDGEVPAIEVERASRGGRDRDRGRDRGRGRGREERDRDEAAQPAVGATQATVPAAAPPEAAADGATDAKPAAAAADAPRPAAAAAPAASAASAASAAAPAPATQQRAPQSAVGFRRGSRGRPAPSGPPPLLEGQTAAVKRASGAAAAETAADAAAPAAPAAAETAPTGEAAKAPAKGAKKAPRKAAKKAGSKAGDAAAGRAPAQLEFGAGDAAAPAKRTPAKKAAGRTAEKTAKKAKGGADRIDAAALGLPRDAASVATYIAQAYKGVGPKSVEALIERFGAGRIFDALQNRPDEVREVMGAARGDRLLEAWTDDLAARRAGQVVGASGAPAGAAAEPAEASTARSRRGRRGGRRSRSASK